MKSMKIEGEDKVEMCSKEIGSPEYPYGLCIHLDTKSLAKLGITDVMQTGTEVTIMAKGYVNSNHQSESEHSDKHISVGIQITDMELKSGSSPDVAKKLYNNG